MTPRPTRLAVGLIALPAVTALLPTLAFPIRIPGFLAPTLAAVAIGLVLADSLLSRLRGETACALDGHGGFSLGGEARFALALTFPPGVSGEASVSPDVPAGFKIEPETASVAVHQGRAATVSFRCVPGRRGPARIDFVTVVLRGRLGLVDTVERVPLGARFDVVPSLAPLMRSRARLRGGALESGGLRSLRRNGSDGDPDGIRAYADGENARLIDWKLSAASDDPLVRTRTPCPKSRVAFAVDCGRLMTAEREGMSALDHALAAMLAAADAAFRRGDSVSVTAFAEKAGPESGEARSLAALPALAAFAASLEPVPVEPDFVGMAVGLARSLPKRSLVVMLTECSDTMPVDAMETAARILSERHAIVIAFLRDGWLEREASSTAPGTAAGFRAAAAAELLELREQAAVRLAKFSKVIVADPEDLSERIVEAYRAARSGNLL